MDDTISRRAAIDYCYQLINVEHQQGSDEMNYGQERVNQTETILHHLELMPSAGPRPRGRWGEEEVMHIRYTGIEEVQVMRCSECKRWLTTPYAYHLTKYDFCPNCGADMRQRGEQE